MYETEVKLPLEDPASLREAIRRAGGRRLGVEHQVDTYFVAPDRNFAKTDEALRVRESPRGRELTYKGPRIKGPVKKRKELNIEFQDDPRPLLLALGYKVGPVVVKDRETWKWGDVSVCIDRVNGLGQFVEVEVLGDEGEAMVKMAMQELGLSGTPIDSSYLEMLAKLPDA